MFVGLFFQFDLSDDYETQIYGITQNEIYYDKGELTIEEADSLADALEQTGYFDDYSTAYVYVEKKNNNYELFFSFDDSIFDDPTFWEPFADLRNDLQQLYPTKNNNQPRPKRSG